MVRDEPDRARGLIVVQASVAVKDVAVATSSMQFFQSIAGLLCIAIMQSYFNQRSADLVPTQDQIMAELMAGVSMEAVSKQIVNAYAKAVTSVFAISIAGAVAGALVALLIRHVPLDEAHKRDAAEAAEAAVEAAASAAALASAGGLEGAKLEAVKAEAHEVAEAAKSKHEFVSDADPAPPAPAAADGPQAVVVSA